MREVTGFWKCRGAQHVGAIPLRRSVEVYELWNSGVQVWEEALLRVWGAPLRLATLRNCNLLGECAPKSVSQGAGYALQGAIRSIHPLHT